MLSNPWRRDRWLLRVQVSGIFSCLLVVVLSSGLYISRARPAQLDVSLLMTIPPVPVWRVASPLTRTVAHGVSLTLTRVVNGAAGAYLTYVLERPGTSPMFFYRDSLLTPSGKTIGLVSQQSQVQREDCARVGARVRCTVTRAFAPQPTGSRLILRVASFMLLNPTAGHGDPQISGPWQVPLTMP